jgi:hypothetical protein
MLLLLHLTMLLFRLLSMLILLLLLLLPISFYLPHLSYQIYHSHNLNLRRQLSLWGIFMKVSIHQVVR